MRLQATSLFFRPLFAFFISERKSRTADQLQCDALSHQSLGRVPLREAPPYGHTPTYLIRDTDRTFEQHCARGAATRGIKVLRTRVSDSRRANAVCERFLLSVRRACLDHFLISMRSNSPSFSGAMSCTFIQLDPIKSFSRREQTRQCILLPHRTSRPRSSLFPCEVADTMTLKEQHKPWQVRLQGADEAPSAEQNGRVMGKGCLCVSFHRRREYVTSLPS